MVGRGRGIIVGRLMAEASESWDPLAASGTASPEPSRECRKRVRKDLREIMKQPLEGIFVWCVGSGGGRRNRGHRPGTAWTGDADGSFGLACPRPGLWAAGRTRTTSCVYGAAPPLRHAARRPPAWLTEPRQPRWGRRSTP